MTSTHIRKWWPLIIPQHPPQELTEILCAGLSRLTPTLLIKTWVQFLIATNLLDDLGKFAFPLWSSVSSSEISQ